MPGADDVAVAEEGHGLVREETPVLPLPLNGSCWSVSSPRDLVRGGGEAHPDWLLDGEGRLDWRENAVERQGWAHDGQGPPPDWIRGGTLLRE